MHKKPWLERECCVKTVLTSASVLWHCRLSFETDRKMEILMPKAEWGVKRTCLGCGARFYDLKRDPIVCPKCEAELDIAVAHKPKRAKPAAAAKAAVKAAVKAAAEKTENLIDDSDDSGDDDAALDADGDADADDSDDSDDVIVAKDGDNAVLLDDDNDDDDEDLGDVKAVKAGDNDLKDS